MNNTIIQDSKTVFDTMRLEYLSDVIQSCPQYKFMMNLYEEYFNERRERKILSDSRFPQYIGFEEYISMSMIELEQFYTKEFNGHLIDEYIQFINNEYNIHCIILDDIKSFFINIKKPDSLIQKIDSLIQKEDDINNSIELIFIQLNKLKTFSQKQINDYKAGVSNKNTLQVYSSLDWMNYHYNVAFQRNYHLPTFFKTLFEQSQK